MHYCEQLITIVNKTQQTQFSLVPSEQLVKLVELEGIAIFGKQTDIAYLPLLQGILTLKFDNQSQQAESEWLKYLEGTQLSLPKAPMLDVKKTYRLCKLIGYSLSTQSELLQLAQEVLLADLLYANTRESLLLLEDHSALSEAVSAFYETVAIELGQNIHIYLSAKAATSTNLPDAYATIKAMENHTLPETFQGPICFEAHMSELIFAEWLRHPQGAVFNAIQNLGFTSQLDEETLRTIDMLFKMNLNLTDTARALFIHRNTLIYRIEKIQKQLGFDLRHFDDCFQLKLLLKIK